MHKILFLYLPWGSVSPTQNVGPIGSVVFDVYWIQTDKQRIYLDRTIVVELRKLS